MPPNRGFPGRDARSGKDYRALGMRLRWSLPPRNGRV
jgi:hypothetical protein